MRALVDLALAEIGAARPGGRAMLLRLSELMFVALLREQLDGGDLEAAGWLAGLRDPLVARALALLHAEPSRAWTVDALARAAGASRSVLGERFTRCVGEPPMRYLAAWRVQLAARRLAEQPAKLSALAAEVGYASEAAFSRAFKKQAGASPARWRRARH